MVVADAQAPVRLIPFHLSGRPPTYFIVGGLVFTPVSVPYLRSEYGKDFDFDAPVKLLEKMMHAMAEHEDQQIVVLSQVLASEATYGYEDILNTQVRREPSRSRQAQLLRRAVWHDGACGHVMHVSSCQACSPMSLATRILPTAMRTSSARNGDVHRHEVDRRSCCGVLFGTTGGVREQLVQDIVGGEHPEEFKHLVLFCAALSASCLGCTGFTRVLTRNRQDFSPLMSLLFNTVRLSPCSHAPCMRISGVDLGR